MLTAPKIPTTGSTDVQIPTSTKSPKHLISAGSTSSVSRITCDVSKVNFCDTDDSNHADKANTISSVSNEANGVCRLNGYNLQPSHQKGTGQDTLLSGGSS